MKFINKFENKINRIQNEIFFNLSPRKTEFIKEERNRVLMYHGVKKGNEKSFNTRQVSINCFKKHLLFLKENCNVISVEDYFQKKFIPGKPNIAITFDDGYFNNYAFAKPLLDALKVPATFYITGMNNTSDNILWADFLDIVSVNLPTVFTINNQHFYKDHNNVIKNKDGKTIYEVIKTVEPEYEFKKALYIALAKYESFKFDSNFDNQWKLMTDEQIIQTGKSKYISIGSHGFLHNNLGKVRYENAQEELIMSKNYLEKLLQKEVNTVAYPDGSYTREIIDFAFKKGLKHQFSTDNYLHNEDYSDERILNRKGIYSCDSCGNQLTL